MRTGGVCTAALLLLATLIRQVSTAEDIYWEGEEDEFLEVKEDIGSHSHLKRFKRFDFYNPPTTTAAPDNYESFTEDQDDTIDTLDNNYDEHGSGAIPERTDPDPSEKTLRVTFVVMEPYMDEYSNRDSKKFQSFSHNLASAVNDLFHLYHLPGTQKASLVRIQSRLQDNFSCKVTLDIVTTADNTDRIADVLRMHIRNTRTLGSYTLTDADFNAVVVNPGSPFETCQPGELQCKDGQCVPGSVLCDNRWDCFDGADEMDCPVDDHDQRRDDINQVESVPPMRCANPIACASSSVTICPDQVCDGYPDCPLKEDEDSARCSSGASERGGQPLETTTTPAIDPYMTTRRSLPVPEDTDEACLVGEFRCDEMRCIQLSKVCDKVADCTDGTDESTCKHEKCGVDDFVCTNNMCIESSRVCDRVFDCPEREDERNCECTQDEFRCVSDGACIAGRKRCDNTSNCRDGSDELNCGRHTCVETGKFRCGDGTCISIMLRCDGFRDCRHDGSDEFDCPCTSDQWQCDQGNCIKRSKRCDGRVDCPSDRSDERNCVAHGYFKCGTGKVIPEIMRCNRRYDCPPGDYSDEKNCPCGDDDFRCNNGHCIQAYKRCDRTHDCQDGSDELHCKYGTDCMAYEYKCTSGECVHAESICNGTQECADGSDEAKCSCKRGQFRCKDGSCINIVHRCDGHRNCRHGEDELNCGQPRCPPGTFTCPSGSCVNRCDNIRDCEYGEDEDDCEADEECPHYCDDKCLEADKICDNRRDCSDGSDESSCENCDGSEDFRCSNGECIRATQKCNSIPECSDRSDELYCNQTMTATRDDCPEFRCRNGVCLNMEFTCDGTSDCTDNSDEENCETYRGSTPPKPDVPNDPFNGDRNEIDNPVTTQSPDGRYDPYGPNRAEPDPYGSNQPATRRPSYDPYGANTPGPNQPGSDPYGANQPGYDPYGSNTPGPNQPGSDPYGANEPGYDPYGSNTPGPNQPGSDPYGANQPGYDPYGANTPEPDQSGSDPYGANQPGYDPYGANTPEPNRPDSDPYGANRPGYDPYGSSTSGPNRPGSDPGGVNRPSYDPYGANTPGSNRPDSDPYGANQPGYDPYGSSTPGPNRPGSDPYGANQPGYDPYGSNTPGPNQPGSDPYGANQPGYDPYGSNTPGPNQPGSDPYGANQPGYDPYGSNTPGPNQPGSDPYGANQPGYDPYGSNAPGSNQPGSDPYGANQPGYDPYGANTPEPNRPGSDPYGANQPGYDPYGSNTPGPNQPGSDPYGANRPGYDPYGENTPESNRPGSDIYGANQPGYDPYGASRPGSNSYGSNQPGSDPYASGSDRDQNSNNGPSTAAPQYPQSGYDASGASIGFGSARGESVACKRFEWRCENGPCIDARRRCDGHIDCPFDYSDEFDCPAGSPVALNLKTHPKDETVRFGGDVVFRCRDEGPLRAAVRWVREGGKPLKPGSIDVKGRLELYQVTLSDSGVYICQTPKYMSYPGSQVRVTLNVNRPERPIPTFIVCKPHEATCGNGDCIPKSAVCDGKMDCADQSDEDMCKYSGKCEPNEFQCENRKCVLKSWICDSDDDCGDGSDEKNCPQSDPNSQCLPMEFACASQSQCIPKSFQCDRHFDCFDNSDEACIPLYVTMPPKPTNVKLNPGETLMLSCQVTGIPVPIISWRRNWRHVPSKCTWTNEGGVGNLTCPDMTPEDSGAYSCEAINNVETKFADPDAIVSVSSTDLCPEGYFNSEARSPSDCIRCFCFGKTTRCQSAELFTHNMPTPLGEGGTRLIGVALFNDGEVRTDPSITNHYHYQGMWNGATVTKLVRNSEQDWLGNFHPYVSLPETYKGNQLMSYGGHIKYSVSFHTQYYVPEDDVPAIIIKGKYATLFTVPSSAPTSAKSKVEVRLTPEYWSKPGPSGDLIPATREDIMMALDAIDMILLRADSNNAGVNITNFVMESAQNLNAGLGYASLVEECTCPEGYDGLSCQKCKPGYIHEKSGPWLGHCVRKPCPPGTYGDPSNGMACLPCPCPLTNKNNQFATTCSLGQDGSVTCDCFTGYEGKTCEKCAAGFEGNPLVANDKCRVAPSSNCNPIGIRHEQNLECVCKDNVQGRYCDQCKNDSFYLSNDFRHGCALCFCSGETQQCMSSNLRRKTTEVHFNIPSVVAEVGVYTSAPAGRGNFRYTAPVETNLKPTLTIGGIQLSGLDRSEPVVYYWSMPMSFAGDKVTAYGGYLRYTLDNMPSYVEPRLKNKAADVQLISENHLTFQYFGNLQSSYEGVLNVSVQLLENGWQRSDGKEVSREHFLLALADVKAILIKATYSTDSIATPLYASIETAEADGNGPAALHVEQCVCPQGYVGTSCEDCAPGYTRGIGGLYLAHCEPCRCNDHSTNCHPETGECYECLDNTVGPHCELCKDGYEQDGYDRCIAIDFPVSGPSTCRCDLRGIEEPCDPDDSCHCKRNVEGENCDRCREGSFGLDASNPDGCIPCYCSGATVDCQEAKHYYRVALPAPIFGDNYGGYTIMDLDARTVINDQFVPVPDKSELMYMFSFPPDKELYWSLPVFPGNRVLSYGGYLSLRQEFKSSDVQESEPGNDVILIGDGISVAWVNPTILRSGEPLSYQVPLREQGWTILNSAVAADRHDFMRALKTLRRVLVKATLVNSIISTSIADVSMDSAAEMYMPNAPIAKGIEMCKCPPGHQGTSCDNCVAGYYRNVQDYCTPCPCNGHDCQLDTNNQVQCNCRPPYIGSDCSIIGLVMELHPTIRDGNDSTFKEVTLTCKYRAPEPLTIKFVVGGQDYIPVKLANESILQTDGWQGEHVMHTIWDTRQYGKIYECHTITQRGSTLGVLFTDMRHSAMEGRSPPVTTVRPPLPPSTVTIRITSPTITIQEVGSSVNFTCKAQSPLSSRLIISWAKADGNLPLGRTFIDQNSGLLQITNLQITDSGQYICQTNDGSSSGQASVTLKVPANQMVHPTVEIRPPVNDYYAGDRIELACIADGSPQPSISWQRASRRPLPLGTQLQGQYLIIDRAREEDSGEYRCIVSNSVGSSDRTALITVRPRPSRPVQDKLVVTPSNPVVNEGQSTRIVCTPQSTNVPTGTIDWVRLDQAPFESNVRSDNGVLYINEATMENQGIYICQTHGAEVSPVPVTLTVISTTTTSPQEAPEVIIKAKSLKIPSGETGTMMCTPTGNPLPVIRWYKHQDEFGRGVSQRGDMLIINEATESDAGYYVCEGLIDNKVVNHVYLYVDIDKREAPKVEIWPPGEQPVALGDTQFEFHCRILAGIPVPDVMWSRASGRTLSSHVEIKPNNILKFDKIEVNDEGEYICTGTNLVGSASASAVLKVRSPPEIVITPNSYMEVHEGDSVNLDCRAEGYPEPWVTIRGPDQREIVSNNRIASLRLTSASSKDEGDYACVAMNSAGTIEETFLIRVESRGDGVDFGGSGDGGDNYSPPISSRPPQDPQRPSDLIAFEGQREITIYCDVTDGYTPQWDRGDRQPLQGNARQEGNRLIIYNVSKNDSGHYVCSVYNYQSGEVQVAANTSLRVVGAPKITLRPPTQTVHPGYSPTVECVVEGDDILEITWKPTYKPFSSRVIVRGATLIFQQIEVEDAGKYECVARNQHANATATAEVIVVEESDVTASEFHEHDQWVHAGDGVVLSCNVSGSDITVRWTKDGQAIPSNVRKNRDGSLFIKLVQAKHAGNYVCHIHDSYGRQTSNYIRLHIEGIECLDTEFRCTSDGSCIDADLLCDGYEDCSDRSDEENCLLRDKRYSHSAGAPDEALVRIQQPRRQYRIGENVEVVCKSASRDVSVEWIRRDEQGNRQYVHSTTYGDGSMLIIAGVQESDAGAYQCIGRNRFGQTHSDSFNLDLVPGSAMSNHREGNVPMKEYSANLRDEVDLPCNHDLEEPYTIQWRREYVALPAEARSNQPILHIQSVKETDAGTYVCRVSNGRMTVEAKAILRVVGVIPRFDGAGWIALPTIKDAYNKFDIEISFKPQDSNGLIMYNSQNAGRDTDYLALELDEGVPRFILDGGSGPVIVMGDRPLALNEWHTIRLNRIGTRVTMDVDNDGPFIRDMPDYWDLLELRQPLYIGGVRDYNQLPEKLAGTTGFSGCVSMLILNNDEKNIMMERLDQERINSCDTCAGHQCQNGGVCQEARLERGYICLCDSGFAGPNCDRRGESCRPGLCGTGKCSDTGNGYKCACPITHTGRNCETRQQIEYPAFTGSAYLALKPPNTYRVLKMSMKVKAAAPVSDGIIMYCAESPRGRGGFTSLTVRNQRLEFRYDLGEGNPAVLVSNTTLPANEWTDVQVTRSGYTVSLSINMIHTYEQRLDSTKSLKLETPMFVGGVDENIVLNSNTGVSSGFMGCIKDLKTYGISVDIVNDPNIESSNLQECSSHPERGDIPADVETPCRCMNGGVCASDGSCSCPPDFTGYYCDTRLPSSLMRPSDPCAVRPCRNGGTCRPDYSNMMNHTCDCLLGYAGASCQMPLELYQSVGFNGNGYLELPASLISYEDLENEPAVIALRVNTIQDGVLAFQRETMSPLNSGDYLLIRIERGHVVLEWDMGGGTTSLTVNSNSIDGRDNGFVTDGEMHRVVVRILSDSRVELSVDGQTEQALTNGIASTMNADSNIYIGGMPDWLNVNRYPGLTGCIDQVEFMDTGRGVNLGNDAVTGRNTQLCKNNMFPDVYPYFDEVDVFESPPPEFFNDADAKFQLNAYLAILIPITLYLFQNNACY